LLPGIMADFLNSVSSENTRETYERSLRVFSQWYRGTYGEDVDWPLLTNVEVKEFISYLQVNKHLSAASVNTYLAALRSFLQFINHPLKIRGPRQTRKPVHALSARELGRLLAAAESNPRDFAILNLMARAGLRVGEVVALEIDDIELGERSGWLTVRRGKGNKERRVPISADARRALRSWLNVRPKTESRLLFLSRSMGPLSPRDVQRMTAEYARRAKLQGVTPHTLRHTFATRAVEAGVDLATLQAILGHESINTTGRYLHPSGQRIAEMVEDL